MRLRFVSPRLEGCQLEVALPQLYVRRCVRNRAESLRHILCVAAVKRYPNGRAGGVGEGGRLNKVEPGRCVKVYVIKLILEGEGGRK